MHGPDRYEPWPERDPWAVPGEMIDDLDEFAGLEDDPQLEETNLCRSCGAPMVEVGTECTACRLERQRGF